MKATKSYKVFTVFNVIIMCVVIFICLFPFLHIIAKALNDGSDTLKGGITFYPRVFTWTNFYAVFQIEYIFMSILVSIGRVVAGTVIGLFVQFTASYVLTRKFYGKKFFSIYFVISSYFSAGLIPTYILFSHQFLSITGTFWVYILPGAFSFYNMIIIRTYISSSISESIMEAAQIDGANHVTIMWRIVLPLSMPIMAAIALFIAIGHWNDWTTTLMYNAEDRNMYTLQYVMMLMIKETETMLAAASGQGGSTNIDVSKLSSDGLISAQVVLTVAPVLLVYPFFQKYFTQGITLGGVKE